MRAADPIDLVNPCDRGGGKHRGTIALFRRRRDHHDFARPGDLRRNRVHQDRGRIRAHPAGDVDADALERADHLAEAHAVAVAIVEGLLERVAMELRDTRAASSSARRSGGNRVVRRCAFDGGDAQPRRGQRDAVELAREIDQRAIAAPANGVDDRDDVAIDPGAFASPAREEAAKIIGLRSPS